MPDDGILILAVIHAAIAAVGLAVLWLAVRRPRTLGVLIGVVIATGFGLIWYGAYAAQDNYDVGRRWYQVGIIAVLYGLPAPVLFVPARQQNGLSVGPVNVRGWVNGVGIYLVAWWVTAFFVGCIAAFGMAQPGSFR